MSTDESVEEQRKQRSESVEPQAIDCRRCNGVKSDAAVADTFFVMCRNRIMTGDDATVRGTDAEATWLILALDLNSPRLGQ